MRIAIEFIRESRCSHSLKRECTLCYKDAMERYLGEEEFAQQWSKRIARGPDDGVDSFTVYFTVPPL